MSAPNAEEFYKKLKTQLLETATWRRGISRHTRPSVGWETDSPPTPAPDRRRLPASGG